MQIPSETQLKAALWQKSTRSGGGEATCVEVTPIDLTPLPEDVRQK